MGKLLAGKRQVFSACNLDQTIGKIHWLQIVNQEQSNCHSTGVQVLIYTLHAEM